jgi:hypothetical protein
MKANEQTNQQVERALRKVSEKFPSTEEATVMTDIHLRIFQETGELMAFDDNDQELTRCVVEQWIGNNEEGFYNDVTSFLRTLLNRNGKIIEQMSILKPFSFVLEDDDHEHLAELYVVDDETVIIDKNLMEGMEKDLDDFLANLLKE